MNYFVAEQNLAFDPSPPSDECPSTMFNAFVLLKMHETNLCKGEVLSFMENTQ